MINRLVYCTQCAKEHKGFMDGFWYCFQNDDEIIKCDEHNIPFIVYSISKTESDILRSVSKDPEFFKQMNELKQNDIIEYNIKMTKFRSYYEAERQAMQERVEKNTPKCPTCGSTNINKISGLDRAASVSLLGIFSKKINKSYQCKDCKFTW